MKKILFAICFFLGSDVWAGKLDIDYIRPSPTITAAAAFVLPGGGWFYLNSASKDPVLKKEYRLEGILYLAATGAIVAFIMNRMAKTDTSFIWPGLVLTIGIRFSDIFSSIEAAEKERYLNSRLLLNYTEK